MNEFITHLVSFLDTWGAELLSLGALTISLLTFRMARSTAARTLALDCVARRREILDGYSNLIEANREQQKELQRFIQLIASPPDWLSSDALNAIKQFSSQSANDIASIEEHIRELKRLRDGLMDMPIDSSLTRDRSKQVLDLLNEQETNLAMGASDLQDLNRAISQQREILEPLLRPPNP